MQKAWLSLLGVLGIVMSCLGYAMNRSETEVLRPVLWPGPSFHSDRRSAIKMFLNGKIHAADVDNILRDTESKKFVKGEEKCSSCSDDPLRVRRSDDALHMGNRLKADIRNASKIKESPVVSSKASESKSSDVTSKPKTSNATSESKTLDVIPKSETADATSGSTNSDATSGSTNADATAGSTNSDVPSESKTSHVTTESKTSHVTSESKTSHVTTESKSSDVTSESKSSDFTADSKNSDVTSEKSPASEFLRNVILLLIDHGDEEPTWKSFEAVNEFPIQGFLENCHRSQRTEDFKFPLDESLVSGGRDECDCNGSLRAHVAYLLSWARDLKDMTTGAVSATNFSVPSPHGYETDLRTNWRFAEMRKESSLFSSTPTVVAESATKVDGVTNFDGIWDVFDMFSRIRMAFFRILLESLGNLTGSEDEFSVKKPFPVQSNVVELVSDTVRELKSLANENGFMMVVAAPGSQMSAVVEVLQSEVSADNTLLVVAGMCSGNNEPVPFFANGPGGKSLKKAITVWELPERIENAIKNGCNGHICKTKLSYGPPVPAPFPARLLPNDKLPDVPLIPPSMWFRNDLPRKRIARANEEDETTSPTGDDKTTKDSEDVENNSDEKTAVPEMEKRSGAEISRVDNVAAILGIATSISAMLAFNS